MKPEDHPEISDLCGRHTFYVRGYDKTSKKVIGDNTTLLEIWPKIEVPNIGSERDLKEYLVEVEYIENDDDGIIFDKKNFMQDGSYLIKS